MAEAATLSYCGLGQMSGTSMDGIDLALCEYTFDGANWDYHILEATTIPYTQDWTIRLQTLHAVDAETIAKTHVDYGHLLGMSVRQFILRAGIKPQFVALHGHTVFHQPHRHFTTQIGCGETAVTHLNCPVVTNFRVRDVAWRGQGAPLVPGGEQHLFPTVGLMLNLGGFANISMRIGKDSYGLTWKKGTDFIAYDLCPANLVLNRLVAPLPYDDKGQIAQTGQIIPDVLEALEGLAFYYMPPPRSLGREWLETEFWPLLDVERHATADLLRTVIEHLTRRLAADLDRFNLRNQSMLVTGGGAHNTFLMKSIENVCKPKNISLLPASKQLIDYKEALIFGFLGLCTLLRLPNTLPAATGATKPLITGSIHLPESYVKPILISFE